MSHPASHAVEVDTARLPLLLGELRLPAIGRLWAEMAERSDREGWPAARFLSALAELEVAERARRRIERHMADARLPPDKTLDGFDFAHVPMLSRARVAALASGDAWLAKGTNLLLFGPPGAGKTHVAAALGRALVENGYRVLFTRTTELVQRLQAARQDLALEAALTRLDRYDLLVLDDLSYVRKDQAETSVLFELISKRYERRSTLITANQPLASGTRCSPNQAPLAATPADRLISAVTVTDPRHPLFGQRLAVVSLGCSRGPLFIAVALPDGRRRLVRRAATDLERPPATQLPTPRVSARTLLPLARHIRGLVTASSTEITGAAPSSQACIAAIDPTSSAAAAAMADAPGPIAAAAGVAGR